MAGKVKVKLEQPVNLFISKKMCVCREGEENYPLDKGIAFAEGRYGFIREIKGEEIRQGTQCPIYGVDYSVVDQVLRIYECGKMHPWKIDAENGDILEPATFEPLSKRDCEYAYEQFHVTREQLKKTNHYLKVKKEGKKN